MQHCGIKIIETRRLILRPFEINDKNNMFCNWASDSEVTKYLTWPAHTSEEVTAMLLEDWTKKYESKSTYNWVMVIKETSELIGNISVVRQNDIIMEAELGYCMGKAFWGHGYMPEAARAVINYLFSEVGFERICAGHDVENPKSGRVMQKIGMRKEGVFRRGGKNNRGIVDVVRYAILKDDVVENVEG